MEELEKMGENAPFGAVVYFSKIFLSIKGSTLRGGKILSGYSRAIAGDAIGASDNDW